MNLVDTHAHLDFTEDKKVFKTFMRSSSSKNSTAGLKEGWIERAKEAGVGKIICVGTSVEASRKCVEIAEQRRTGPQIYASVGIHAQDGRGDIEKYGSLKKCIEELRRIVKDSIAEFTLNKNKILPLHYVQGQNDRSEGLQNDKRTIVGVGECGFDVKSDRDQLPETRKFQRELFEAQIKLAVELKLPLLIHCRNAFAETFELLRKFSTHSINSVSTLSKIEGSTSSNNKGLSRGPTLNSGLHGVFHSWTGSWDDAQKALEMGFYISFSGIVTFGNAPNVQEVASRIPLDRMILETDSPFLAPHPLRGSPNEPKNVKIVGKFIADLRGQPFELISSQTTSNAIRLFGL